eukprot:CAMPEP_0202962080 /NCGR_PEP_ID=MMETSP1396-20130829/6186_1 /ASSEMBLY_ACC=CAM_ASM_000872 /TAXON_ID= /ORGANISM="Pseudokeronopsis sp., Strain Brazil" /LENGTH=344 /DNA_ID=CAMNT_0049682417 /DNA_START=1332 /DNA_END=2366 /DNA_ORIENTATION=-
MEYNSILDMAAVEKDPARRLALVAAYSVTLLTCVETITTKPFNPLLGETYEYVCPQFKYFAEQVCHHPPITAVHCEGKSGYLMYTCNHVKNKFTGRTYQISASYNYYVEFPKWGDKYEIVPPQLSANNLIIGTMYIDLHGQSRIRNTKRPEYECVIEYFKRGWRGSNAFKVEGAVTVGNRSPYKISGHWNDKIYLVAGEQQELVWTKTPPLPNAEYFYGMSQFMLQLNYLPPELARVLAPTDTRWRPDQRALENGEMKLAAAEKTRLEEKQRTIRKYKEAKGEEHKPAYFFQQMNEEDGQLYWRYNFQYFEKDRKEGKWDRLMDLYSDQLPPEVQQFFDQKKKK